MSLFHYSDMTYDELTSVVTLEKACQLSQAEIDELTDEEFTEFLACCSLYED